jgi:hypothetical protein
MGTYRLQVPSSGSISFLSFSYTWPPQSRVQMTTLISDLRRMGEELGFQMPLTTFTVERKRPLPLRMFCRRR